MVEIKCQSSSWKNGNTKLFPSSACMLYFLLKDVIIFGIINKYRQLLGGRAACRIFNRLDLRWYFVPSQFYYHSVEFRFKIVFVNIFPLKTLFDNFSWHLFVCLCKKYEKKKKHCHNRSKNLEFRLNSGRIII